MTPPFSEDGPDGRHLAPGQRNAEFERGVRPLAQLVQEERRIAVPAHEQGLRGAGGHRPRLQERIQELADVSQEGDRADHCAPGCVAGEGREGRDDRRAVAVPVDVRQRRGPLPHGRLKCLRGRLVQPVGPAAEAQAQRALRIEQHHVRALAPHLQRPEPAQQGNVAARPPARQPIRGVLGQARRLGEVGGIRQALPPPVGDLCDLELRDGVETGFDAAPEAALIAAIEPGAGGEHAERHDGQDDRQRTRGSPHRHDPSGMAVRIRTRRPMDTVPADSNRGAARPGIEGALHGWPKCQSE